METAAGIVGLIGFGFQLCSQIDNIISSYRSSQQELSAVSSNVLSLCNVLEVLDKKLKVKRVSCVASGGSSNRKDRSISENSKETYTSLQEIRIHEEAVLSESQACLQNVLDKCWGCLFDIQRLIEPFRGGNANSMMVRIKWMRKKSDVQLVMSNLESCKSTLSLTLMVLQYCGEDEEKVDRDTVAIAIQKQVEQLKSEKDENYTFVMQRYLDCASTTIGSPKSTLVRLSDDVKSLLVLDDTSSIHSREIDSESELEEDSDPGSFNVPFFLDAMNMSHTSLHSFGIYQKVGDERKSHQQRKKAKRDSGIVIEDDDLSTFSRDSDKWKPFMSLGYKLEWYRRNFRPDINGRLTGIRQMADTTEFNVQELLLACKDYTRPITPSDLEPLRKKRSRDRSLTRVTPTTLKPPDEDFFRTIVRIQKSLASLSNLRTNALEILSTPPVLIRSSSLPLNVSTQSSCSSNSSETPLRPYVLDALNILITIHHLSEGLHQRVQQLTLQRDQMSKSSILMRLQNSGDVARYEHTKRTFANIEAKIAFKYAQEGYARADDLWRSAHGVINAALEAEFFFFDDMDRILSAATEERVDAFNALTRKNSFESEILDSDVNRAYAALVASAERQRGYTMLDHRLRSIMLGAKSVLALAEGKIEFIPGQGKTLDQLLIEIEDKEAKEAENLQAVFKYLSEYVNSYIVCTMGRLEVALAKFGERLYIPLNTI